MTLMKMTIKFPWVLIGLIVIYGCGGEQQTAQGNNNEPAPRPGPEYLSNCERANLNEEIPTNETPQSIARYYSGALFSKNNQNQPEVSDVRQAGFNVCYFYAFLSSYVTQRPDELKKSIKQIKGGFEVLVHDPSTTKPCVYITDQQLGIFRRNGRVQTEVLWPEVLAAAWVSFLGKMDLKNAEDVQMEGTGLDRERGRQELRLGKTIDMNLVMEDPFYYFLDLKGQVRRIKPKIGDPMRPDFFHDSNELLRFAESCVKSRCIMYAYIAPGGEVPGPKTVNGLPSGLFDHHCYGVLGVNMPSHDVTLRNPHGGQNARAVSYRPHGVMIPAIQVNERFNLHSQDFYQQFYTLQFSKF